MEGLLFVAGSLLGELLVTYIVEVILKGDWNV